MALKEGEVLSGGFVRDKNGALSVSAEGTVQSGGFMRDSDGRVVLAGTPNWSEGDNIAQFSTLTSGRKAEIRDGGASSPVTAVGPTLKINRTEAITEATMEAVTTPGGDGADSVAGVQVMVKGTAASETQTVAGYFSATNASNHESKGANPQPDAAAIYAMGRVIGGSSPNATAIGAVVVGRRESGAVADLSGMELHSHNRAAEGSYASAGHSDTTGLWLTAAGTADSGCGISIGNPDSIKFKVGIGIPNQNGGAVADSSFRDDGKAKRSIDIRGEHETAAMSVEANAGSVVIGAKELSTTTTQKLELNGGSTNRNPILRIQSNANTTHTILFNNTTSNLTIGQVGSANAQIEGSVAGDGVIVVGNSNQLLIGRSAVAADLRVGGGIGFFGTAPKSKPTVTGAKGGNAALESLVSKLAELGLITNSTS